MSSCLKIFLSFIVFVTLFACVPQYYQLSREQLELQESYKRALMERIGSTSKSEVEKQNEQYITEEELANKINGLPASSEQFFFTSKKDGFEINRKIYLDPEGQIVVYSGDSFTGDITYMVKIDTQNFVIKYMKASSNLKPIKLANAKKKWKLMAD